MNQLEELARKIKTEKLISKPAMVTEVTDVYIKADGPQAKVNDIFIDRKTKQYYKVIKGSRTGNLLMPLDGNIRVASGEFLYPDNFSITLPENIETLKGAVLDGFGNRMDEKKEIKNRRKLSTEQKKINPLSRKRITEKIETGIKAVDGLITIGRGQKIGIFAGSGVGKSTLLSMIAKRSSEDINVIALIGERGREVREFIERDLGEEGMKRSVVIVATSEDTPLKQIQAAELATTIAELFRDRGKNVLLMMDSITRFVMAKRIIDTANGEVPIMGGKTISLEHSLQKLLERSGNNDKGSITGIYTVLVEGEDFEGPIPDMARGILDGHIVLKRKLADKNHFPAIDVLASISRVMQDIAEESHYQTAREIKKYLSIYEENEDQISLGLVERGKNQELDRAIALNKPILEFLQQDMNEFVDADTTILKMRQIIEKT